MNPERKSCGFKNIPIRVDGTFFFGFAVEFAGYVWTVAVFGKKKLQIQKYPDACGQGLIYFK